MNNYMDYIKCGEIFVSLNYKEQYILKCSECNEVYSCLEELLIHCIIHYDTEIKVEKDTEIKSIGADVLATDPLNTNNTINQSLNDVSIVLKIETEEPKLMIGDNDQMSLKVVEVCKTEDGSVGNDSTVSSNDSDVLDDADYEWEPDGDNTKSKERRYANAENTEDISLNISRRSRDPRPHSTILPEIIQNEEKPFVCDECGSRLKTSKSLKRHRRIHLRQTEKEEHGISKKEDSQEKPFVCGQCGSRLKTSKSLKRHLQIHLRQPGEKEQPKAKYECEHCKKVFPQSGSLKDHLRTHTDEQPFLCSECGKAFKNLGNLKQHFLRHGTGRRYECPHCPKKFQCRTDLASHKLIHSNTKSYICDVCGAGFMLPYMLKKHKKYHNGERNHKCDYCDKRFVLADQCRRHMRTHTGEKPYKCKYCARAFAQSNDLVKHLRGHLGDNVYKCEMCPQGFRLLGELRAHYNIHKNDDDDTRTRNLQALKDDELRIKMKFGSEKTLI